MSLSPEVIAFLRKEAKRFYKELIPIQRNLVTKQQIFSELKKSWKAGNKVKRQVRDAAKDLPIDLESLDKFEKKISI